MLTDSVNNNSLNSSVKDASQTNEEFLNDIKLVFLPVGGRRHGRAVQRDAVGRHV